MDIEKLTELKKTLERYSTWNDSNRRKQALDLLRNIHVDNLTRNLDSSEEEFRDLARESLDNDVDFFENIEELTRLLNVAKNEDQSERKYKEIVHRITTLKDNIESIKTHINRAAEQQVTTAPPAPGAAAPPAPGAAEQQVTTAPPAPGAAEQQVTTAPPAPGAAEEPKTPRELYREYLQKVVEKVKYNNRDVKECKDLAQQVYQESESEKLREHAPQQNRFLVMTSKALRDGIKGNEVNLEHATEKLFSDYNRDKKLIRRK